MNLAQRMIRSFLGTTRAYNHGIRRKYSGDELREIRARNGVGRRHDGEDLYAPNVDAWVRRNQQVNRMYARWLARATLPALRHADHG